MKQKTILIKNVHIVNEGTIFNGDILIEGEYIKEISESISAKSSNAVSYTHLDVYKRQE